MGDFTTKELMQAAAPKMAIAFALGIAALWLLRILSISLLDKLIEIGVILS